MSFRLARVAKLHPASRTADVVFLDDGGRLPRVPILGEVSGNSGSFILPEAEPADSEFPTSEREMIACVMGNGLNEFVILGFLPPPRRQGIFADGRSVTRYPSDAYMSVDKEGNAEFYHPSGTFVRVGTPGHEDLSGQDVDGEWAVKRNTSSAPTVTVGTANAGASKSTITIDPTGAVAVSTQGTTAITAQGAMTFSTAAIMSLAAAAGIGITSGSGAGDVTVSGTIRMTGDLLITGDIVVTGGDVVADGVSLKNHVHTGVTPGGGLSGIPDQ